MIFRAVMFNIVTQARKACELMLMTSTTSDPDFNRQHPETKNDAAKQ
jgi:hypothetical protein